VDTNADENGDKIDDDEAATMFGMKKKKKKKKAVTDVCYNQAG